MSDGLLPLVLGTVLALVALTFVLLPLLSSLDQNEQPRSAYARRSAVAANAAPVVPDEGLAIEALREIEFDRATGKLSDSDYEELKAKYTRLALSELREQDDAAVMAASTAGADEDPVEAAVRAVQARRPKCPTCGPRPESDSVYCSSCGSYLPGACGSCGAKITQPGARFCTGCGGQLAAA
jgi:hypothetical protein